MRHSWVLSIVVLTVAYGMALWAAQPKDNSPIELSALLTIEPHTVQSVLYKGSVSTGVKGQEVDSEIEVLVTRTSRDSFWVKTQTFRDDDGVPDVNEFKANADFKKSVLNSFDPLETRRVLVNPSTEVLEEIGLVDSKAYIELRTDSGPLRFEIGMRNFISPFVFMRDEAGLVILTGTAPEEYMSRAETMLFENRLFKIDMAAVDRAIAQSGERVAELLHTKKSKDGKLIWSKGNESSFIYESWMKKIERLGAIAYSTESERARFEDAIPILSVRFLQRDDILQLINFYRFPVEPAKTQADGAAVNMGVAYEYWGKSDFTEVPVKLDADRMKSILASLEIILR